MTTLESSLLFHPDVSGDEHDTQAAKDLFDLIMGLKDKLMAQAHLEDVLRSADADTLRSHVVCRNKNEDFNRLELGRFLFELRESQRVTATVIVNATAELSMIVRLFTTEDPNDSRTITLWC